jgi:hypothetical protein
MTATIYTDAAPGDVYLTATPIAGGSAVDLTNHWKNFDPGMDANYEVNSAGGHLLETEQRIRGTCKPRLSLPYRTGTAGDDIREVLFEGAQVELIWGPEGGGSGKPKFGIYAEVKKFNATSKRDGLTEIECEFVNIGSEYLFYGSGPTADTFS